MPKVQRYYLHDEGDRVGITRSNLRQLGRDRQVAYMRAWFFHYFEDPVHETPFESAEGGYQYIWGGPYDALEKLGDEFSGVVPEARIEELAKEFQDESADWAPTLHHPDRKDQRRDVRFSSDAEDETADPVDLDDAVEKIRGGANLRFGTAAERSQRKEILNRLEEVERQLQSMKPIHGGLGHNQPPPEEIIETVAEVPAVARVIRREIEKARPDAAAIGEATSRLTKITRWIGKKFDAGADAFAKAAGTMLAATVVIPFSHAIWALADSVLKWLLTLLGPLWVGDFSAGHWPRDRR